MALFANPALHFGGFWVFVIKFMKVYLRLEICVLDLSWQIYYTLSDQVESAVRSRPLTPMSTKLNDFTEFHLEHF